MRYKSWTIDAITKPEKISVRCCPIGVKPESCITFDYLYQDVRDIDGAIAEAQKQIDVLLSPALLDFEELSDYALLVEFAPEEDETEAEVAMLPEGLDLLLCASSYIELSPTGWIQIHFPEWVNLDLAQKLFEKEGHCTQRIGSPYHGLTTLSFGLYKKAVNAFVEQK